MAGDAVTKVEELVMHPKGWWKLFVIALVVGLILMAARAAGSFAAEKGKAAFQKAKETVTANQPAATGTAGSDGGWGV